jgi:hypothetical protein
MVEADKAALTEAAAAAKARTLAQAGTQRLTDSANLGTVGLPASDFARFLSNTDGFCDPNPANFPLPAGMTCANGTAAAPLRPVNADLLTQAILDDRIVSTGPLGWKKKASDNYLKLVLPNPPSIPKGDVLATPGGRAQLVAYQSWAAKAGVVNWILSSSAAMGEEDNYTTGQQNYGGYSYRRALKEMAAGTFDPANPFADSQQVKALAASKDTEKGNIQLVAYKIGAVQSRLLYEIHNRLEMIAIADAVLLSEQLSRTRPSGAMTPTSGR